MSNTEEGLKDKLLNEYKNFQDKLNGSRAESLKNLRQEALANFERIGFPTLKHEEWRYSNVSFLYKHNFNIVPAKPANVTFADIKPFLLEDISENLLVFVNGHYMPELSVINSKNSNLLVTSMADAEKNHSDIFARHFGKYAKLDNDAFTSINTAYARDGAFVMLPDNTELEEPIHLLLVNDQRGESVLSQPRNLIVVGNNSRVRIMETYHSLGDNYGMTNTVTEIVEGEGANVEYNKVQNDPGNHYYIGTTQVQQQQNSVFISDTITLDGIFVRNNLNSVLNGEHCEANFNGLYFISGKNIVDNHTLVDHAMPNCNSNELYKGIIDDKATAVFNGKIMVRRDAQKTNAYQSNKNILLSDEATINTKPQLEIYADDVKCSHGATSGSIDEESMFYLRARGISREKAKALLLNAFASDVVAKISTPALRSEIGCQIAKRLDLEDLFFCSSMGVNAGE